jgi:NAD(P)-dependent dehydrogenase (short-subunit alcohol dehydrogenase family)
MPPLDNRVALITGGGTGIGRATALQLARAGCRVAVCGRRAGPLDGVIAEIESAGGRAIGLTGDVSEPGDARRLVDSTVERLGGLDILVNNAAIEGGGSIHAHDVDTWDRVLRVNLRGPFLMARFALAVMRGQKRGHIINVSSESGLSTYAGDGAYGISKHALNALGEFIQVENQALNIRVDTVCPGMVLTPMTEGSPGLRPEACLTPEDIGDLILWLVTRRDNVKIGTPILIQTMVNPWA